MDFINIPDGDLARDGPHSIRASAAWRKTRGNDQSILATAPPNVNLGG
jgi:hypothetical protein